MNKGLLAVLVGLTVSGSAMANMPAPAGWLSNPLLCPSVKDFVEQSAALKAAKSKLEDAEKAEKALDKALADAKEAEDNLDKLLKENPGSDAVKAAEKASDDYLKAVTVAETASDKALKDASAAVAAAEKEKAADRKEMVQTIIAFRARAKARETLAKEGKQFRKARADYNKALKIYGQAAANYYKKCTDKGDTK